MAFTHHAMNIRCGSLPWHCVGPSHNQAFCTNKGISIVTRTKLWFKKNYESKGL